MTLLSNYPGCKTAPGGGIDPACTLVNPLQGIQAYSNKWSNHAGAGAGAGESLVTYAKGCEIDGDDDSMIAEAVEVAVKAGVVVIVAGIITCQEHGQYCQEAEALDRVNITLPGQQLKLIQAIPAHIPVVLVVMGGATVSVPWAAEHIPAVVQLWYPGEEGGTALADILFGAANPSGRLSETIFTGDSQLPSDYLSMSMTEAPGRTHRYLTETPLYSFGYGLSYTQRSYSNMKLTSNTLSSSDGSAKVD